MGAHRDGASDCLRVRDDARARLQRVDVTAENAENTAQIEQMRTFLRLGYPALSYGYMPAAELEAAERRARASLAACHALVDALDAQHRAEDIAACTEHRLKMRKRCIDQAKEYEEMEEIMDELAQQTETTQLAEKSATQTPAEIEEKESAEFSAWVDAKTEKEKIEKAEMTEMTIMSGGQMVIGEIVQTGPRSITIFQKSQ